MSIIKKINTKSAFVQIIAGFSLWFLFLYKKKKTPVIIVGEVEPLGLDYISTYFKDSEYFGNNVIPNDYYVNWLEISKNLDKIREGFGNPILIKKGFNITETNFIMCKAVEIFPQNNNVVRLTEVIEFLKPQLTFSKIELKNNKNIYLEL